MCCESARQGLRGLLVLHKLSRGHKSELVYPKGKVHEFFTIARIKELGACCCRKRGCCFHLSEAQPPKTFTDEIVSHIRDRFTSALALLVSFDIGLISLIFELIEKDFNDEWFTEHPLTDPEICELLSTTSSEKPDRFDVISFHRRQHQFFIPRLVYKSPHLKINSAQSLPFTVEEEPIGSGAYSVVYAARLLHEYHDFPDVKDGRIAVKTYQDWSAAGGDCIQERTNNEFWGSHEYIMPLQGSLEHRDIFMTIWPLAKHDLREFLRNDPPKEYSDAPKKAWKRFTNLLSALNHIHSSNPNLYGYHFDIKPHNILVRFDGDWAITDLGLAYSKLNDSGVSETSRHGGNERYRGPELLAHRNYDVWAMGCIGCEIIVWLNKGADGVEQFRKDRLLEEGIITLDNFHHKERLKQPVIDFFKEMENHDDNLTRQVAAILREMLEIDPRKRLNARAAEEKFGKILEMPPPTENVSRRPSVQNVSLSPLQAMRSRRPSLNVNIPSERSARRKSPSLSATLASENNIFLRSPCSLSRSRSLGSPNPKIPHSNVPQIQVTSESDTSDELVRSLKKPDEYHSTKRALPESPVMTESESRFAKARRIEYL